MPDQRLETLGILLPFTWSLASAEIEFRVNRTHPKPDEFQRSEEDRALTLDKVVDVPKLVLRYVERRDRSRDLQPVGWALLRKPDPGRASRLEVETDLSVIGVEVGVVSGGILCR